MSLPLLSIALAGNPNVGKSTIFNGLTGLHQYVANWSGVTVSTASGTFTYCDQSFEVTDLPGTYSLTAHSEEERVTADYLRSGKADLILVVADATCLERGLSLLAQITVLDSVKERQTPVLLCINLCDEAEKKGIHLDLELLEDVLQIPVLSCCARSPSSLDDLKAAIAGSSSRLFSYDCLDFSPKALAAEAVTYTRPDYRKVEERIDRIVTGKVTGPCLMILLLLFLFWLTMAGANYPSRLLWDSLFFLEGKLAALLQSLNAPAWFTGCFVFGIYRVLAWVLSVMLPPMAIFFPLFTLLEDLGLLPRIAFQLDHAFECCHACGKQCLTMAMGLGCNAAGVVGCRIIDSPRERLIAILTNSMTPCNGRFPTFFTMIALMFAVQAPPAGEKPLAAGNTLAAADSASTASTMNTGFLTTFLSALILTLILLLSIAVTLVASRLLSMTVLKGLPSAFTLELPPYRMPQVKKVLIRSLCDRTLFVLGRAAAVAAPAGFLIWVLANIHTPAWFPCWLPNGFPSAPQSAAMLSAGLTATPSLLTWITGLLQPLGRLMGLDGVILTAFLLSFPANEILLPIILMAYLQTGTLAEMTNTLVLKQILTAHGWTTETVICLILFSLFHWPCSTTCLTIKKESGSMKWTALAILLPTVFGFLLCTLVHGIWTLAARWGVSILA